MSCGDIGYWPVGKALCFFFGPTPASEDDRPRAASPVNIVGRVNDKKLSLLKKVDGGQRVEVDKV